MARRWWALPAGVLLPLSNGERYRLLSPGRPGGSRGPDVLDAVFCSALSPPGQEEHRAGDVEFHVRSSDWFAHLHQDDVRYNNVILHVVLVLDDPAVALRQDGTSFPTCCLNDLPPATGPAPAWPCQQGREQEHEKHLTGGNRGCGAVPAQGCCHARGSREVLSDQVQDAAEVT